MLDYIDYDRDDFLDLCEEQLDSESPIVYLDDEIILMLPNVPGVDFTLIPDGRSRRLATISCKFSSSDNEDDNMIIQPQQVNIDDETDDVIISLSVLHDLYSYISQ